MLRATRPMFSGLSGRQMIIENLFLWIAPSAEPRFFIPHIIARRKDADNNIVRFLKYRFGSRFYEYSKCKIDYSRVEVAAKARQ
jgi:hypothetical protein